MAELYSSATLMAEYDQFARARRLDSGGAAYRRYVRLRTLFEALRDGGLWHLQWTVTDREPNSRAIFEQWRTCKHPGRVTAQAECDELSAVLGFFCDRLGVPGVGLLWPTSNHTVACWCPRPGVRVVIPTSQIFLPDAATLGTSGFDPFLQPQIYPYKQSDAPASFQLPPELTGFCLEQIRRYGAANLGNLCRMRSWRAAWQRGQSPPRVDSGDPFICEFWRQYG
jgi:hypothetical protein